MALLAVVAPKIKVKLGGKVGVEPEDPGEAVKEQRPKRGKRKRNELKAAHEVHCIMSAFMQPEAVAMAPRACLRPLLQHDCRCLFIRRVSRVHHASPSYTLNAGQSSRFLRL